MPRLPSFPLKNLHLPRRYRDAGACDEYEAFKSNSGFFEIQSEDEDHPTTKVRKGRKGVRAPSITPNTMPHLQSTDISGAMSPEKVTLEHQKCESNFLRCEKKAAKSRHPKQPMWTTSLESEAIGTKFVAMKEASACSQCNKSSSSAPRTRYHTTHGRGPTTDTIHDADSSQSHSSFRPVASQIVHSESAASSPYRAHGSHHHQRDDTEGSESSDNVVPDDSASVASPPRRNHRRVLHSGRLAPSPRKGKTLHRQRDRDTESSESSDTVAHDDASFSSPSRRTNRRAVHSGLLAPSPHRGKTSHRHRDKDSSESSEKEVIPSVPVL